MRNSENFLMSGLPDPNGDDGAGEEGPPSFRGLHPPPRGRPPKKWSCLPVRRLGREQDRLGVQAGLEVSEFLESRRKLPLLTQLLAPTWEGCVTLTNVGHTANLGHPWPADM